MDPVSLSQLPKEIYYVIGFLVVANVGGIYNWFSARLKKETEFALLQQQISFMNVSLGELKATVANIQNQMLEIVKK